jgi:glycosyltransferase involved in cell wall biosynthesis
MANYWAERGWPVTMLTLEPASRDFYALHPAVARVGLDVSGVSRSKWRAARNNLHRVRALRRAIQASQPEIVISFMVPTTIITLLATCTDRVPVIVSERSDPIRFPLSRIWGALRRLTYPLARAVVVQTPEAQDWAGTFLRKDAVHVIPNAVPTSLRENATAGAAGLLDVDDRARHVISIGRMDSWKGFDLLVRAFAACADRRPDWKLTILGDGPERPRLESLAKELGVEARVRLPGTVADPTPFLRRADLFVLSSRFEGFPNALLEAMAAGLPVIATECASGPKLIVRHGVDGLLVPSEDATALAHAMATLLDDEPRRLRMGKSATDVTKRFDVKRIMESWETVIDGIVTNGLSSLRRRGGET